MSTLKLSPALYDQIAREVYAKEFLSLSEGLQEAVLLEAEARVHRAECKPDYHDEPGRNASDLPPATVQSLRDALDGLLGMFGTPAVRLRFGKAWGEYHERAIQDGRAARAQLH